MADKILQLVLYSMKTLTSLGIVLIIVIAAIGLFVLSNRPAPANAALTQFAQCLSLKNVTMYGAEWCPHCQNEKKAFGDSFRYVPYVECPAQVAQCVALGIDAYPTWILGDGTRLVGEQGLEKLSEASGCILATSH